MYRNGIADIIRGDKAFFQVVNDSIAAEPRRIEPIFEIEKHRGVRSLKKICISINKEIEAIPVAIVTEKEYSSFHGYKPVNAHAKYRRRKKANRRYRFERMNGRIIKISPVYTAEYYLQ